MRALLALLFLSSVIACAQTCPANTGSGPTAITGGSQFTCAQNEVNVSAGSATTYTTTFASNVTAGHALVVGCLFNYTGTVTSVTFTDNASGGSNTYGTTVFKEATLAVTSGVAASYVLSAKSTGSITVTATEVGATIMTWDGCTIFEIPSTYSVLAFDGSGVNSGTTAASGCTSSPFCNTTATVNTTRSGDLLVAIQFTDTGTGACPATGYSFLDGAITCGQITASSGALTATMTDSANSDKWIMVAFALSDNSISNQFPRVN